MCFSTTNTLAIGIMNLYFTTYTLLGTSSYRWYSSCDERHKHIYYFHHIQVGLWKSKVDRQCIERMKNFQNPPLLVGQVMEMVMTLIGKRLPGQRMELRQETYPSKEGESGRFSSSSSSTKLTVKKSEVTFYCIINTLYTCFKNM